MAGRRSAALSLALIALLAGCGTVRGVAALRDVDFELDRVSGVRIGGVPLDDAEGAGRLPPALASEVAAGVLSGHLPLECDVLVRATNPPVNSVTAELVRMDWTLLLDGRETVGGQVLHPYTIPPGASVEVPVHVQVDLLRVLGRQLPTLLRLAEALAGDGKSPIDVRLRVVPILDTPLGPMRFPHPVTIPLDRIGR
jgi:hypothetical protein